VPKVHDIGSERFVQFTNFPFKWGKKFVVRGWTQEINEPFRTSTPLIVRLPFYKAFVMGKWTGNKTEEEALNLALERRDVTYDDFTEEKGWTPAPDSDREASSDNLESRFDYMDGAVNVRNWSSYYDLAKATESSRP
jgi:hypothetical protein